MVKSANPHRTLEPHNKSAFVIAAAANDVAIAGDVIRKNGLRLLNGKPAIPVHVLKGQSRADLQAMFGDYGQRSYAHIRDAESGFRSAVYENLYNGMLVHRRVHATDSVAAPLTLAQLKQSGLHLSQREIEDYYQYVARQTLEIREAPLHDVSQLLVAAHGRHGSRRLRVGEREVYVGDFVEQLGQSGLADNTEIVMLSCASADAWPIKNPADRAEREEAARGNAKQKSTSQRIANAAYRRGTSVIVQGFNHDGLIDPHLAPDHGFYPRAYSETNPLTGGKEDVFVRGEDVAHVFVPQPIAPKHPVAHNAPTSLPAPQAGASVEAPALHEPAAAPPSGEPAGGLQAQTIEALEHAHRGNLMPLVAMHQDGCFSSIYNLDQIGQSAAQYDKAHGTASAPLLRKAMGDNWRFTLMQDTYDRVLGSYGVSPSAQEPRRH